MESYYNLLIMDEDVLAERLNEPHKHQLQIWAVRVMSFATIPKINNAIEGLISLNSLFCVWAPTPIQSLSLIHVSVQSELKLMECAIDKWLFFGWAFVLQIQPFSAMWANYMIRCIKFIFSLDICYKGTALMKTFFSKQGINL